MTSVRDPADLAQGQLDAYNTQDLERFCAFYAADVVVADFNGAVTTQGIDAYRARYAKLFAEFPQNRVVLLGRMIVGNVVMDHERVHRSPDGAPFEVIAIYTVRDGKIARVDFAR